MPTDVLEQEPDLKQIDSLIDETSLDADRKARIRSALSDKSGFDFWSSVGNLPKDKKSVGNILKIHEMMGWDKPTAEPPAPAEVKPPPTFLESIRSKLVKPQPNLKITESKPFKSLKGFDIGTAAAEPPPSVSMPNMMPSHAVGGTVIPTGPAPYDPKTFNTILTPNEEKDFQKWKKINAPKDSGVDYDLRGAYKANLTRDPANLHFSDRFKKPNHPTFSDQSQYAQFGNPGHWLGDGPDAVYVPPQQAGPRPGTQVPMTVQAPALLRPPQPGEQQKLDVLSRTTAPYSPYGGRGGGIQPPEGPPQVMPKEMPIIGNEFAVNVPGVGSLPYGRAYEAVAGPGTIVGETPGMIGPGGFNQQALMQTPAVDLSAMTDDPLAKGLLRGVSGMTTPQNAMLMASTMGLGEVATPLAQISSGIEQVVANKGFHRLMSAAFTADMLRSYPEQFKAMSDAADAGDVDRVKEIFGEMAVAGLFTGMAFTHARFGSEHPSIVPPILREGISNLGKRIDDWSARVKAEGRGEVQTGQPPPQLPEAPPPETPKRPPDEEGGVPAEIPPPEEPPQRQMTPVPQPEIVQPTEGSQVVARNLEPLPGTEVVPPPTTQAAVVPRGTTGEGLGTDILRAVGESQATQNEFLAEKGLTWDEVRAWSPEQQARLQNVYTDWLKNRPKVKRGTKGETTPPIESKPPTETPPGPTATGITPPAKPKRRSVSIINGEPDLLNHIEELGAMRMPTPESRTTGNYDGYDEVMTRGEAKFLTRKETGLAPDDLRQQLNSTYGYNFETTSQLYDAIQKTIGSRDVRKAQAKADAEIVEANRKFDQAVFADKGRKKDQKGAEPVPISDLKIGDKFNVVGEEFTVAEIHENGDVVAEDGRTFPRQLIEAPKPLEPGEKPPPTHIYPDKGTFKPAPETDTSFEFGEAGPPPSVETPEGPRPITTLSGRVIEPPIQKSTKSVQGVTKNVRAVDSWLVEQAKAEAKAKGDDFAFDQFDRIDPKKITQSERDSLNVYLFGVEEIPIGAAREGGRKPEAPPAEPPIEGERKTIRLFRGQYAGERAPIPEWVMQGLQESGALAAEGRWWTEDSEIAKWYQKEAGDKGEIVFIDVPADEAQGYRVTGLPEAKRFSLDPEHEFFLPESFKGKGEKLPPAGPPPEVGQVKIEGIQLAEAPPTAEPPQTVTLPHGTEATYRRESDWGPFKTHTYDVTKSDIPGYAGSTLEIKHGDDIQKGLTDRVEEAQKSTVKPAAEAPPAGTRAMPEAASLTSEQVGKILEDQFWNRRAGKTAEQLSNQFVTSSTFDRKTVPLDFATPVRTKATEERSYSTGPIIIENYKGEAKIIDGQTRWNEAKARGDTTIEAYVGNRIDEVKPWVVSGVNKYGKSQEQRFRTKKEAEAWQIENMTRSNLNKREVAPAPPTETAPPPEAEAGPPPTLQEISAGFAKAGEESKQAAANDLIDKLGLKAAGNFKSAERGTVKVGDLVAHMLDDDLPYRVIEAEKGKRGQANRFRLEQGEHKFWVNEHDVQVLPEEFARMLEPKAMAAPVESHADLLDDATEFISELRQSRNPAKNADEAWRRYQANRGIGVGLEPRPTIPEAEFKMAWEDMGRAVARPPTETPASLALTEPPTQTNPADPTTIADFNEQAAAAQQAGRGEAANEVAGRAGMMGGLAPSDVTWSMEGSPLFGSSQKGLFDAGSPPKVEAPTEADLLSQAQEPPVLPKRGDNSAEARQGWRDLAKSLDGMMEQDMNSGTRAEAELAQRAASYLHDGGKHNEEAFTEFLRSKGIARINYDPNASIADLRRELKTAMDSGATEGPPKIDDLFRTGPGAQTVGSQGETPSDIAQLTERVKEANEAAKNDPANRISVAVRAAKDFEKKKDALSQGIAATRAATASLWDWYRRGGIKPWTDYKDMLGKYLGGRQRASLEAFNFAKAAKKIPRLVQEGIVNWMEANGDRTLLQRRADATRDPILKMGYQAALRLDPEHQNLANNFRNYFDSMLENAKDAGLLDQGVLNYVNHIWKKENTFTKKLKAEINAGLLRENPEFAKKRIWQTFFEGEQAGREAVNKGIGYLVTAYDQAFNEAIGARAFMKSLAGYTDDKGKHIAGGVGKDGKPLVVMAGSAKPLPDSYAPDRYLVRPRTHPKITKDAQGNVLVEPQDTSEYKPIDHPSLRGWKWVTKDTEGNPVYLQSDMLIHPEIYGHLKNVLGRSAIRQNVVGRAVLTGGRELKGLMLSASGFHQTQESLHALFHLVIPGSKRLPGMLHLPEINLNDPVQLGAVNHGLMVHDYDALQQFSEGLSSAGLLGKVPGIGALANKYQEFLFQGYIPRLKMELFKHAVERNRKRYRAELSDDQIQELTANQANAAFGELNYKMMGRNPTLQDTLRLIALAPDFLEARMRFVGQAAKPYGREQAAALIRGALFMYGAARIGNQLSTGDPHLDRPFSIIVGGREYMLRSIQGDLIHAFTDPGSFVYHRLNPSTVRTVIEAITKRDQFGRARSYSTQLGDFFRTHVPISIQGPLWKESDNKLLDTALTSMGVTSYRYRTNAARLAKKYVYEASSKEEMSPENLARFQLEGDLRNKLRENPEAGTDAIREAINQGKITQNQALGVMETSRESDMARYTKRLSPEKAAEVYMEGSEAEREELLPILQNKVMNFLFNSTPTDQEKLITNKTLLKIFPALKDFTPHVMPPPEVPEEEESSAAQPPPSVQEAQP